jgi:hypothetical protein
MFYSKLFLPTFKETPSDAEVISHVLMLRAGLIRKVDRKSTRLNSSHRYISRMPSSA